MDIIFLVNLPRWLFAVWSRVDNDRWPTYARVRRLTFWLFWGLSICGVVAYSCYQVFELQLADALLFVNTLIALAGLSLAAIIDYHFNGVIAYHARGHQKRIERERKEKEKKTRAEERYKRHSTLVIGQNDMNLDGSGVPNPIIVPENKPKKPEKT